jgi:sugar phosphate isomerase/epimerase
MANGMGNHERVEAIEEDRMDVTEERGPSAGEGTGRSWTRRSFLRGAEAALIAVAAGVAPGGRAHAQEGAATDGRKPATERLKLGLVTYNLAKAWDIETIIKNCAETKFEAVELRTTHAHGVEVSLGAEKRREVRKRFESSPVRLASLGSAFEFQSADAAELRRNIEGAKEYARLAADVGAEGIKVRPNGLQTAKGIPEEDTLKQIGHSLAEVAAAAAAVGVEVRVEVHGEGTSRLPAMKKIIDHAAHGNVHVCWNSNQSDLDDGGFDAGFALVRDRIRFVHMRDLYLEEYPFRRLLRALRESGYRGYCCAEIPESQDPIRVMRYYRALFLAYQDLL